MSELIEPSGEKGAVRGFGAPLAEGLGKESLHKPLERGAYVLATPDRKTVLRMLVLSKEEAGFDPEAFVRSNFAAGVSEETLVRIRATWTLAQFTFESHDPMVYPALDFLLQAVTRMAFLAEGVVSDPIARRYLLPEQVMQSERSDPRIDSREHVSVNMKDRVDGSHTYTLGMQKFRLPEFEIVGLHESDGPAAYQFLIALCQSVLLGGLARSGDRIGAPQLSFEAREGGFDKGIWEGTEVLELLPPTAVSPSEALAAWQVEAARLS
jgi:hypothetical protein